MKKYLPDLGLLAVGVFWGLGFIFVKIGLNDGITPLYLLCIRFCISALIMLGIFLISRRKFKKNEIKMGIMLGIVLYVAFVFQTIGAQNTTTSNNAFFTAINVIVVPYVYWTLHKHVPDKFAFIASIICLLGIGIMSFDDQMNLTNLNLGDFLTIISAIFFALQIGLTGYYGEESDPINITTIQMIVSAILSIITLFIFRDSEKIVMLKGTALISVLYLSIFATTIAFFLQMYCQKFTTSTRASIFLASESLLAPIFAFLILHERLGIQAIIGGGLILLSIIISETKLGLKNKLLE